MYSSKGAIHYITESEINKAKPYLMNKIKDKRPELFKKLKYYNTFICFINPIAALRSVDFPTFGLPTIATVGSMAITYSR